MVLLLWNLIFLKDETNELVCQTNRLIDIENKLIVTKRKRGGEG